MRKTALVFLAALAVAHSAHGHGPGEGHGMGPWMMWGYGMGWLWPFIMIVFAVVVIVGMIVFIRWVTAQTGRTKAPGAEESAIEILKKRYAKGEIDKEEYDKIKKDIVM